MTPLPTTEGAQDGAGVVQKEKVLRWIKSWELLSSHLQSCP